ncbi:putative histidinol-phosphate aminotransferase [[Candida] railenensis]|uniref:histidinol-phosphate transaminase n=1 Tax=[Candida] railenensis TaxID=45579 RepID=A0A9P0QL93_9ASCO|nr:putative histidinol-phosphate aminotransferase [[Candida] railenensis]
MFDIKSVVRPNILGLEPYRCARDDFKVGILLDANENTKGPALTSLTEEEELLDLNRYPDPHQIVLKQQIVDFRNLSVNANKTAASEPISPDNLCLGVGSDESIDMLMRCCCTPGKDKILTCPPTYGMYSICATVNDVDIAKVPLLFPGFQIDVESIISTIKGDSTIKLIYLTSPGNPTGQLIKVIDIIKILEVQWNGFVVVDEAYIDFTESESSASESMCTLVNQYPNLVVLQTLSKSFGLAGIRLGITYSSKELASYLNAMKYPYNISSLTANIATRATGTETGLGVMRKFVDHVTKQRQWVLENLQKLDGIGKSIGGFDSNFLLLEILDSEGKPSNHVAEKLYTKLATENQVVVRFRGKELNCTGCLRISIGSEEESATLVETFRKCLKEVRQ